jgi:hypothetical protein
MIAQSTPPLRDMNTHADIDAEDLDPDSANKTYEPVRPAEASRIQMLALAPSPARLAMIGGGIAAAIAGGVVGYWLGRRHAPRLARPGRHLASTVESALELAPVAMHLLANPIVRALAIRVLLRQIGRRIER